MFWYACSVDEGDTLAAIAQDYGVSDSNISFIVSRKTFKHVTP